MRRIAPNDPSDVDYYRVWTHLGRSYEVRVAGSQMPWYGLSSSLVGATLERTNAMGAVLTNGAPLPPTGLPGSPAHGATVRWIASTLQDEHVRVTGPTVVNGSANVGPDSGYQIVFYDTTYQIPRWNNNATQQTVFIIQNVSYAAVSGNMDFHDATGQLVHSEPFSIPADGVLVFNTLSVPALAGLGGSATIAHDGGCGALAGKGVALEPATGFSFDTPMAPVPY
jgi:hypothetical protein